MTRTSLSDTPLSALPSTDAPVFARVTAAGAGIAGMVASVVLVGWALELPRLRSLPPDPIPMLPNVAVGLLLVAIALWLHRSEGAPRAARRAGLGCAALAFALGIASLVERVGGWSSALDTVLFSDAVGSYPYRPVGLMATNSALCLTLAALSLLLACVTVRGERRPSQLLATIGLTIASLALVGHAYSAPTLYAMDAAAGMALITAVGFAAVHVGILFCRPTRGAMALLTGADLGGLLARRLLPATIVVPLMFGWLWLKGREHNLFSRERGIAYLSVLTVGVFISFVVRSALALRDADRAHAHLFDLEARARQEAEGLSETLQEQAIELELRTERAEIAEADAKEGWRSAVGAAADAEHARALASTANRAKSDFLSMMSHELRTPLNAIDGYAELLEMGIRGPLTPLQAVDVARIRRSERLLLAIVNDLLNFIRLDAGQVQWRLDHTDVFEVIEEAEPIVMRDLRAKHLVYNSNSCERSVHVMADRDKLVQILVNLLSNACKFTPDGGQVNVDCSADCGMVRIVVRDTGRGIAADRLDSIFEPFVQVDRQLMRDGQHGIGLGLSISRDLATGMGGTLTVESVLGYGSAFTLTMAQSAAS